MHVNAKLDAESIMIDKKSQSLTPCEAVPIRESYQWINLPKESKETGASINLTYLERKCWIKNLQCPLQNYWTQKESRSS